MHRRILPAALLLAGMLACAAATPAGLDEAPCTPAPDSVMHIADVRALAGEYRLTEIVPRNVHPDAVTTTRLWLWPTSARDTTADPRAHYIDHDTLRYPLYGTVRPLGKRESESDLRASVDPIYPPVLIETRKNVPLMLYGTVSDRRDGTSGLDGGGSFYRIDAIDQDGCRGKFTGYGILVEPAGYYCAVRVGT